MSTINSITSTLAAHGARGSGSTGRDDGTAIGPGGKMGKQEFLQLLVTQLRYQDPMNPMDGQRMAADLAQFSGLEQLLNIGTQLETQQANAASMLSALNNTVAIGTIGKTVTAVSDQIQLAGGAKESVTAKVAIGGTAVLKILDAKGNVLGSRSLGAIGAGEQSFPVGSAAAGLASGTYRVKVEVTDANNKVTDAPTLVTAKIDGITYGEQGAMLTAGPLTISIGSIIKIS